jgi:hypothetical protein
MTCKIGLTKFPDPDCSWPGLSKEKIQHLYDVKYTNNATVIAQEKKWCAGQLKEYDVLTANSSMKDV